MSIYEWLGEFERQRGHKLRVLHIGNIANNAYNNAKIQRQRGIDADVLSFDYYHIMACPEWEDAEFLGKIEDDNFPDWWAVDLRGFRRPNWFVQAPFDASVRYLLAKTANAIAARPLWHWLEFERWMLCRRSALRELLSRRLLAVTGQQVRYVYGPVNAILMKWAGALLVSIFNHRFVPKPVRKLMVWKGRRLCRFGRTADIALDRDRHLARTATRRNFIADRTAGLLDALGRSDCAVDLNSTFWWWYHPYFSLLLKRYDIVQAYATYSAMPFIASHQYLAYEHGTLRSIPFQDTDEGRTCMASYHAAAAVFITNMDNLSAADAMRLDQRRVVALPHAFDSDKLARFAAAIPTEPLRDGPIVFFTPTRQHWIDQDPGWAKGNDRMVAALKIVRDSGRRCVLRAVAWGKDLDASKALVREFGIEGMVEWLPVMKKRDLWSSYLRAHAVIDQFVVPSISGVTFEAMMLGRRVISAVDEAQAAAFFGEAPPLYCCASPKQIAAAMASVIDDPQDARGDGKRNQDWMQKYHSADRIVALQVQAYAGVLSDTEARRVLS